MMDKTKLYVLDKNGDPQEVKVLQDPGVIAVDTKPAVGLPEFQQSYDFSVEVDSESMRQLQKMLDEIDREILEAYDVCMKALECCLQDVRRCRECPLKDDDSCRGHLLHNGMKVLLNHKELHRQTMLGKWVERKKTE